MSNKKDDFYIITKEILNEFTQLFVSRPYFAVIDLNAKIHHLDNSPLNQYLDLIQSFVQNNFNLLKVGDHSFPLGGVNLCFFKVSSKAILIIYTAEGPSGQLLSFKHKMFKWTQRIDDLIGEIEIEPPTLQIQEDSIEKESEVMVKSDKLILEKDVKGFNDIPVLKRELTGKEKFPLGVAQILQLCDGKHSIDDICNETNHKKVMVNQVIKEYQNKKWIEMKRVLL